MVVVLRDLFALEGTSRPDVVLLLLPLGSGRFMNGCCVVCEAGDLYPLVDVLVMMCDVMCLAWLYVPYSCKGLKVRLKARLESCIVQ